MFIVFLIVVLGVVLGLMALYFHKEGTRGNVDITSTTTNQWWAKKRAKYNAGLIIAGITAFIMYVIIGEILIAPYDNDFEVTLFTIAFQGLGYLFMMGVANLFYNLGPFVDKHYNKYNTEDFRERLFKIGFLVFYLIAIHYSHNSVYYGP